MEVNKIYNEDCLEGMKRIPDGVIDMILCDLPYEKTEFSWDKRLDITDLWREYRRIIKPFHVIALFGQEPFSSMLRLSNLKMYKYDLIWIKSRVNNFLNCKFSPLKVHEKISIFSEGGAASGVKNPMPYNLIGVIEVNKEVTSKLRSHFGRANEIPKLTNYTQKYINYPKDVLYFRSVNKPLHPTQKPVDLLEYLIKTYTNEGELVLDNCIGSGSTAVAAINTNRNFIGFETEKEYFDIANNRIAEAQAVKVL